MALDKVMREAHGKHGDTLTDMGKGVGPCSTTVSRIVNRKYGTKQDLTLSSPSNEAFIYKGIG